MNPSSYGHKFFIFGGVLLIVIAGVQLLLRPRARNAPRTFHLDAATVQALFFLAIGMAVLLAGVGVLPLPGDRP